jgi:hypothetical protein
MCLKKIYAQESRVLLRGLVDEDVASEMEIKTVHPLIIYTHPYAVITHTHTKEMKLMLWGVAVEIVLHTILNHTLNGGDRSALH